MNDLAVHLALFAVIGVAIVGCSAIYSERDDRAAWKRLPGRLAAFFVGCGILAGILLVLEHTVARVG